MAGDVDVKIAEYFKKIHTELIWPTLSPDPPNPPAQQKVQAQAHVQPAQDSGLRPERLIDFHRLLMKTYVEFMVVLDPARPCRSDDDCEQTEVCVKGVCMPSPDSNPRVLQADGEIRRCRFDDECLQTEVCSKEGYCVPNPFPIGLADTAYAPNYAKTASGGLLSAAIQAFLEKLHKVIVRSLSTNPSLLAAVRDALMNFYAEARVIALKPAPAPQPTPCHNSCDCAENEVCVKGICVPIPFRIVFTPPDRPFEAPWV